MKLHQSISSGEYIKAILIHYFSFRFTYINVGAGFILLAFGLLSIVLGFFNKPTYIFTTLGIFLLIRPVLYIWMKNKEVKDTETGMINLNFELENNIVHAVSGEIKYSGSLEKFNCFRNKKGFILIYLNRTQFLVLDQKQMANDEVNFLLNKLVEHGVKKK